MNAVGLSVGIPPTFPCLNRHPPQVMGHRSRTEYPPPNTTVRWHFTSLDSVLRATFLQLVVTIALESSKYLNRSVVSVQEVGIGVPVGLDAGAGWFWSEVAGLPPLPLIVGRGIGRLPSPLDMPKSSVVGAAVGELVMLEKSLA